MKFQTIKTGSDGNCFLFEDSLLLDAGIPFKTLSLKVDLSKVTHILLTHIHGDHFNKTTIRKLFVENDKIIFVCGDFLTDELLEIGVDIHNILELGVGDLLNIGEFKISPIMAYHDVPNFGYRIMKDNHKHIHITDTSTLEGITAKNYDSASIECNHCDVKVLELIEEAEQNGEFTHLKGAINSHLSVQETLLFCKDNNIKELHPVHIGNSTRVDVEKHISAFCEITNKGELK